MEKWRENGKKRKKRLGFQRSLCKGESNNYCYMYDIIFNPFVWFLYQVTSVLGPFPRNPFQSGKFFQDLSEFVGQNPGIFKFLNGFFEILFQTPLV